MDLVLLIVLSSIANRGAFKLGREFQRRRKVWFLPLTHSNKAGRDVWFRDSQ